MEPRQDIIRAVEQTVRKAYGKFIGTIEPAPSPDVEGRLCEWAREAGKDFVGALEERGLTPGLLGNCRIGAILASFPEIDSHWLLFGTKPPSAARMEEFIPGRKKERPRKGYTAAEFAKYIKDYIEWKGLTLYRLSKETGVSSPVLYNAIAGRTNPSEKTIDKIRAKYPDFMKD